MFSIKMTRKDDGSMETQVLVDDREPTEDDADIPYSALLALLREATFNIEANQIASQVAAQVTAGEVRRKILDVN